MVALWEDYLQRHGLPIIRPQEPFVDESVFNIYVPPSPPVEHRVWAFFLMNNAHLIANHSYDLEDQTNQWCDELLIITQNNMPTLNEQRNTIFERLPYLERLWNSWQNNSYLFTSSLTSGIVPIDRRLSFVPAQRHH